jgi:lambda family phage tail tape measure protein
MINGGKPSAGGGRGFVNPDFVKPAVSGRTGFDFGAGKETDFDKLKKSLEEQLAKTGELTKLEEVLRTLQNERYKDVTRGQRQQLENIAKQIDREGMLQKVRELSRQEFGAIELLKLEGQQVGMTAREYEKLVDAKKNELAIAEATKKMNAEDAAAYRAAAEALYDYKERVKELNYEQSRTFESGARKAFTDYVDMATNAARASEMVFSNAFRSMEDALLQFVTTGKLDFKSLTTSILADIARIQIRKAIAGIAGAIFPGSGGTVNTGTATGADMSVAFANGGIMTSKGALPLNMYANGGVANSPQLALFGEGRMNEAYVPLPDGRSIPVTMKGAGGTNVTVNVSVEKGGEQAMGDQGAGNLGRVIANVVKTELINQKRPGGLLA